MMIVMTKKHNNLRARAKDLASKSIALVKDGKHLEGLLQETLNFLKDLKEETPSLKDEFVAAYNHYF